MYLRKVKNVVPSPAASAACHEFVRSELKELNQEIKDSSGKVIATKKVVTPVVSAIDPKEFENEAFACEMFTVENLQRTGFDPFKQRPITTPLFGMTLDTKAAAVDALDNFNYEDLTEEDFETSNNNNK